MARLKVSVIGPESTGKTSLVEKLADKFETHYIPEYAREYIEELDRHYVYEDLLSIAKEQRRQSQENLIDVSKILFTDTSLLTMEIWSMDKFNMCDPWIVDQVKKERFDLYLLCDIDTIWVFDKQREDPSRRKELFDLHLKYLNKYHFPYEIVSGLGEDRLTNAVHAVEKYLRN